MVESVVAEAEERRAEPSELTQEHPLIRSGEDCAAFWQQHAAGGSPPEEPAPEKTLYSESKTVSMEQLHQVWQQANWLRVIEVFDLTGEHERRRRDDEIWLKSPLPHHTDHPGRNFKKSRLFL